MRQLSLVLVLCGVFAALFGIFQEQWKAFVAGIVLIFAAAVFATLHLSSHGRID